MRRRPGVFDTLCLKGFMETGSGGSVSFPAFFVYKTEVNFVTDPGVFTGGLLLDNAPAVLLVPIEIGSTHPRLRVIHGAANQDDD